MTKNQPPPEGTIVVKRSKALLYFAFALTAIGAILSVIVTIIIFMPTFELTKSNFYKIPHFYLLLTGLILVTAGLILQRKITPPMEVAEAKKLRSRLE